MPKIFIILLTLGYSLFSFAEYRVFKLEFTNTKTNQTRQIQSTLDPEQFKSIYPLKADETVTYVQTWRCKGNTSQYQPHCQSPEKKP